MHFAFDTVLQTSLLSKVISISATTSEHLPVMNDFRKVEPAGGI